MPDKPTPLPRQTDDHICQDPQTIGFARTLRKLVIPVILLAIGSLGGAAAAIAGVSADQAELRADVRHLAERQAEIRASVSRLADSDQRMERESAGASREVLVQLGSLRTEVQQIADRLERLEDSGTSRRGR